MAEKYTVKAVMPTGKSHETFGTEYYVQFNEVEGSYPLWFKNEPTEGQEIVGTINGSKFKKEKKEWTKENPTTQSPPAGTPSAPFARRDNSDGQRQGMCFNNAATYVNLISQEPLSPADWAKAVGAYARALYKISDLNAEPEAAETVASIFGPGTEEVK